MSHVVKLSTDVRALTDLVRKRTEVQPAMMHHAENEGEVNEATKVVEAGSNSADAGSPAEKARSDPAVLPLITLDSCQRINELCTCERCID